MVAVKEEIFGAVATILLFDTEEEVIQRANNSPYGLSAGIFTRFAKETDHIRNVNPKLNYNIFLFLSFLSDLKRAHRVSNRLQSGTIWVNNFNVTPVELPFGGFKQSGIGRECSTETIQFYTQSKSVYFEMNDIDCPLYKEGN